MEQNNHDSTEYQEFLEGNLAGLPVTEQETLVLTADFFTASNEVRELLIRKGFESAALRLMSAADSDESNEILDLLAASLTLMQTLQSYGMDEEKMMAAFQVLEFFEMGLVAILWEVGINPETGPFVSFKFIKASDLEGDDAK